MGLDAEYFGGSSFTTPVLAQPVWGARTRKWLVPAEERERPLWLWQGQKQSSKVLGFLEKAQHKDSFVQLVNTSGPCRHLGCVCRAPCGKPSPAHLLLPRVLQMSFPLLNYFYFFSFCVFFSCVSICCLGQSGSYLSGAPQFLGSCLGTWHPTRRGCAVSSWEAASPVPEWDGPWEKRPVSLWGFKKTRLFLQRFSIYFG